MFQAIIEEAIKRKVYKLIAGKMIIPAFNLAVDLTTGTIFQHGVPVGSIDVNRLQIPNNKIDLEEARAKVRAFWAHCNDIVCPEYQEAHIFKETYGHKMEVEVEAELRRQLGWKVINYQPGTRADVHYGIDLVVSHDHTIVLIQVKVGLGKREYWPTLPTDVEEAHEILGYRLKYILLHVGSRPLPELISMVKEWLLNDDGDTKEFE